MSNNTAQETAEQFEHEAKMARAAKCNGLMILDSVSD